MKYLTFLSLIKVFGFCCCNCGDQNEVPETTLEFWNKQCLYLPFDPENIEELADKITKAAIEVTVESSNIKFDQPVKSFDVVSRDFDSWLGQYKKTLDLDFHKVIRKIDNAQRFTRQTLPDSIGLMIFNTGDAYTIQSKQGKLFFMEYNQQGKFVDCSGSVDDIHNKSRRFLSEVIKLNIEFPKEIFSDLFKINRSSFNPNYLVQTDELEKIYDPRNVQLYKNQGGTPAKIETSLLFLPSDDVAVLRLTKDRQKVLVKNLGYENKKLVFGYVKCDEQGQWFALCTKAESVNFSAMQNFM